MKSLLWLPAFCLAASLAQADLVIEQKVESSAINGVMTMKVKGSKARMEMPTPGGQMVSIMDLEKGKMNLLMMDQKMTMETDLAAVQKRMAAAQKPAGETVKPVATGRKEKIGDWDADEYTATVQGMAMHLWSAANFPKGKEISQELARVSKLMSMDTPDPNSLGLPGMVVKSEVDSPIGKITTTLQSAKQAPVADAEFVVPADFKVMKLPAGLGGQ